MNKTITLLFKTSFSRSIVTILSNKIYMEV